MSDTPEIALSVITYQRPHSLALALESVAAQRGVEGKMELVVTDDGSVDETPRIVEAFRRRVSFPVKFVTHPHMTFQAARCRNAGAAATSAPYLLFLDGDCVLPPHHVATHLERRRPSVALTGDVCRLEPEESERVTVESIRCGNFDGLMSFQQRRHLRHIDLRYRFYNFIRHPTKPRNVRSGDFSIWRADYVRVNGFDENFCGWGGEDDDLGRRLRRAGVQLQSILRWTCSYHLWHPRDVTAPADLKSGSNADYLKRKGRLTNCRNGLVKRSVADLSVRLIGQAAQSDDVQRMIAGRIVPRPDGERPEVELVFLPGDGRFSGDAEFNVLVALEDSPRLKQMASQAHVVVAPIALPRARNVLQFRLNEWDRALEAVA